MQLNTKKALDYYVGGLMMGVLKPAAWLIGRLLHRNHHLIPKCEIVFIKMLGAGSLVIALPALLGLRRGRPDLKLTLVTTNALEGFARSLGIFDRILLIDESSLLSLIRSSLAILVRLFRVDTVVDLEIYSRLSSVFATLTCARNRIGFYLDTAFWRKNHHTHLIFYNRFSGVYHFYMAITEALGCSPATILECQKHLRLRFRQKKKSKEMARRIAIGHACSDMAKERILNVEQWSMVFAQRLDPSEEAEIILLGAKVDRAMAEDITAAIKSNFPNLKWINRCGTLSQEESVRELALCDEFWGVDSVLLHFARLLCGRCLSFWGPTDPATRLISMDGLKEEIRYRKLPCSPCIHIAESPPCRGNNLCVQGLFRPEHSKDHPSWMV